MGSTKKDIWDAYKKIKEELDAAPKDEVISTTAKAKEDQILNGIATANGVNVNTIENVLENLVLETTKLKSQYDDLLIAIDTKKTELKEVHNIEVSANDLAALAATKQKLIEDTQTRADEIKNSAVEYKNSIIAEADAINEEENLNRIREEELYEYNLKRARAKKEDEIEDFLNSKKRSLDGREESLLIRENEIKNSEDKIKTLEESISVLEATTQDKINTAVEQAVDSAKRSNQFQANMVKAHTDANEKILNSTIASLETKVEELQAALDKANTSVENASIRVSDMAQSALNAQGDAATISKVSEIAAGSNNKK